jgi:hypothetical protein
MFARLANGNAKRTRAIEGQATLLNRTMHGIVYDAIHDEIVVPHPFAQAVITFAGSATGEVAPKRIIQGPRTGLIPLDRLGVDPVNDEIYVPEGETLIVYPREARGNVAPKRILGGSNTGLNTTRGVVVDPVRNLIVVAGGTSGERGSQLAIFERTASGDVKPRRVIAGPRTGLRGTWNLEIHPPSGMIFVVQEGFVGVWSIEDEGDAPPRYQIGGPKGVLDRPRGVALDPAHNSVFVSDKGLNAVLTFELPEVFRAPSTPSSGR